MHGRLVIISGPAGAGKTTLAQSLCSSLGLLPVVTATTRSARPGETEGYSYTFLSLEQFKRKETAGDFVETKCYNNQWYGTPRSLLDSLKEGRSHLITLDISGGIILKKLFPTALTIWLTIDPYELRSRMEQRGESAESIEKRLQIAQAEEESALSAGIYEYRLISRSRETTFQQAYRACVSYLSRRRMRSRRNAYYAPSAASSTLSTESLPSS